MDHHLDDYIELFDDAYKSELALQGTLSDPIQNHHLITDSMVRAIDDIGFAGGRAPRNRRSLQYLSSPGGHVGWEHWHRAMEKHLTAFITRRGPKITEKRLLKEIQTYYQRSDIRWRIPDVNLGF